MRPQMLTTVPDAAGINSDAIESGAHESLIKAQLVAEGGKPGVTQPAAEEHHHEQRSPLETEPGANSKQSRAEAEAAPMSALQMDAYLVAYRKSILESLNPSRKR